MEFINDQIKLFYNSLNCFSLENYSKPPLEKETEIFLASPTKSNEETIYVCRPNKQYLKWKKVLVEHIDSISIISIQEALGSRYVLIGLKYKEDYKQQYQDTIKSACIEGTSLDSKQFKWDYVGDIAGDGDLHMVNAFAEIYPNGNWYFNIRLIYDSRWPDDYLIRLSLGDGVSIQGGGCEIKDFYFYDSFNIHYGYSDSGNRPYERKDTNSRNIIEHYNQIDCGYIAAYD